jgi:uncharacterized membrane protein YesL
MMLMGILFSISCVPIFTIGAALSGFYYAAMDSMRKEDGYIFKRYFSAFAKNFKKATLIWLILLVIGAILGIDVFFWMSNSEMSIAPVMFGVSLLLCLGWLMTFIFVFPLQARFENPIRKTIENAFLLAISHLPFTIVVIALIAIVGYLCTISWLVILVLILAGNGVLGYLLVHYYETNFKKWGYIDENDGKLENDDFDFTVEIDYDEIRNREKTMDAAEQDGVYEKKDTENDGDYKKNTDETVKEDTGDE